MKWDVLGFVLFLWHKIRSAYSFFLFFPLLLQNIFINTLTGIKEKNIDTYKIHVRGINDNHALAEVLVNDSADEDL